MTLDVNNDQGEALARVLRDHLSNLRMEIGKTDSYEWRQDLKRQEELLQSVLQALDGAPAGQRVGPYAA